MRFHSPPTVVTFAGLALWSVVAAPAQEKPAPAPGETLNTAPVQETVQAAPAFLRWKNGDALPGKLLESEPGQVHWASPLFTDELVVDAGALDSVFFPEQPAPPTEAFRVGTVSGDVWVADLIGADHDSFLFSSLRHGPIRVKRSAVHSLDRRQHPNLVFDGSQLSYWNLQQEGAIKHMTYKVYESKKWSRVRFPEFFRTGASGGGRFSGGLARSSTCQKGRQFWHGVRGTAGSECAGRLHVRTRLG